MTCCQRPADGAKGTSGRCARPASILTPALICGGEGIQRSGFKASRHLMSLESPPTAIFCGNDRSALGAYQALAELGLRIPEDVSIVGFDDQDLLRDFFHPPLTTVRLPFAEMGRSSGRSRARL